VNVGLPTFDCTTNCSGGDCDSCIVEQPTDMIGLNTKYAQRAVSIIANHSSGGSREGVRFFLYVAFAHTHTPLAYSSSFENASPRKGWYKVFGNTLAETDHAIGEIVDAVDADAALKDQTLIVLTSDNGPADLDSVACEAIGDAGPYVGAWQRYGPGGGGSTFKTTTWEGGHRVLGVVRWSGHLARPGRSSSALVSTLDLMPTFAALSGAALPAGRSFDGLDLSAVLLHGDDRALANRSLFHMRGDGNLTAGRHGSFKFFWETSAADPCRPPDGPQGKAGKTMQHEPPLVFDVDADPSEALPVRLPDGLYEEMSATRAAVMLDIETTMRSPPQYDQGGWAAVPCCNRGSQCCRCRNAVPSA